MMTSLFRATVCAAVLSVASSAHADCAPNDFECGLSVVELGQTPSAAPRLKSQLVEHDTKTPKVIGGIAGVAGGLAIVTAWTLYVARQGERLQPRSSIGVADVERWETLGSWSFWLAAGGSASLVASEYLLLPPSDSVPTLAWIGGAAGLGVAAVGLGFAAGGSHCSPIALRPGTDFPTACLSGTSDAMFGSLLLLTAAPLLNLPLTYLLRDAFSGPAESLTLGPGSIQWRRTF